jgi:hypothetical protein
MMNFSSRRVFTLVLAVTTAVRLNAVFRNAIVWTEVSLSGLRQPWLEVNTLNTSTTTDNVTTAAVSPPHVRRAMDSQTSMYTPLPNVNGATVKGAELGPPPSKFVDEPTRPKNAAIVATAPTSTPHVQQFRVGGPKPPLVNQTLPDHVTDHLLPDFPYNLSCPRLPLTYNVSVTLVYNVGMINNWFDIVRDQMTTIHECGLGAMIHHWIVTFSYGHRISDRSTEESRRMLLSLLQTLPFSSQHMPDVLQHVTEVPWEGPAMNLALEHCKEREQHRFQGSDQHRNASWPTVVFYMHTKGSSHYDPHWKWQLVHLGSSHFTTYGQTLYWRKYMEYFTIERPHLCLSRLLPTIPMTPPTSSPIPPRPMGTGVACGVEYHPERPHFSGNFWAATCDYIARTREPLAPEQETSEAARYVAAEFFISKGVRASSRVNPFVNLASYQGYFALYRFVMLPELYRFTPEQEEENYANVAFPIIIPDIKHRFW